MQRIFDVLYNENYKILMKEIKDQINKDIMFMNWRIQHCKISILAKLFYRFTEMLIKIPEICFIDIITKLIPKFPCEDTGSILVKIILTRKSCILILIMVLQLQ